MNNIRVTVVIRTCPKASLFSAFRRFGFERRQPVGTLNSQKSSENPQPSGRRFFIERIFGSSRQNTAHPCGLASILTNKWRKLFDKKHGSDYYRHPEVRYKNVYIQNCRGYAGIRRFYLQKRRSVYTVLTLAEGQDNLELQILRRI